MIKITYEYSHKYLSQIRTNKNNNTFKIFFIIKYL